MAKINDVTKITDMIKRLTKDNVNAKIDMTKFISALVDAYPENIDFLESQEIKLQPSQWLVLAIEPQVLEKTVLRAKDLGYIVAYQQNPAFIKQDADKVTERMSLADANGISYINEKGKYLSFIFSERGFNYVLGQSQGKVTKISDDTPSTNDLELLDAATRVMEAQGLTDKKDVIYEELAAIEKEGFGLKEALMAVFTKHSDNPNPEFLGSIIDEVLQANEEDKKEKAL